MSRLGKIFHGSILYVFMSTFIFQLNKNISRVTGAIVIIITLHIHEIFGRNQHYNEIFENTVDKVYIKCALTLYRWIRECFVLYSK
jgi:hypothetical protein